MKTKRIVYWSALAVTGLAALGLKAWAMGTWISSRVADGSWERWMAGRHHLAPGMGHGVLMGGMGLAGLAVLVLLALGLALWYRRNSSGAHPWEDLGMEYAEGRITREQFLARKAVLEESK